MISSRILKAIVAALAAGHVAAHPGADPAAERRELAQNEEFAALNTMNLAHCAEKLETSGVLARAIHRRSNTANSHMQGRSLKDVKTVLATDHEDNSVGLGSTQDEIFATRDDGCVLMPEVTEGPFYVEGQHLRGNLTDNERGVKVYYDLQIIDVDTCEPVEAGVFVEIWTTNAAGHYSGVESPTDPDNTFKTFSRGVLPTNDDGAVLFLSVFPGHYAGRTPHVHIATHHPDYAEWLRNNNTIQNNVVTHNGQLYFDQRLVDAVRKISPYTNNKQRFIRNDADAFFEQAASVSDPVLSYFFLDRAGEGKYGKVEGGILAWKLVGVNMTNTRRLSVAGTFHPPTGTDLSGFF
ncbi:Intradiol ring-cleavage dioxygenase [Plectosphaerella cucumerina]|uniref:Intradiol ring-cleavage dioxygenase n=1 Tax=Plectosphaerella cucumerina TaxID=40658 RepID=A0A8K0TE61_9PEZI|nr:Intradiol ring-cleavage dioxygenase [Plectosphaerella cucumerina]